MKRKFSIERYARMLKWQIANVDMCTSEKGFADAAQVDPDFDADETPQNTHSENSIDEQDAESWLKP